MALVFRDFFRPTIRSLAFLSSLALVSACAGIPPNAQFIAECEHKAGRHIYDRLPPGGVADPFRVGHGRTDVILGSGADWVETSHLDNPRVQLRVLSSLFIDGSGRYIVRLDRNDEPECRRLLQNWGFDPDSLRQVSTAKTQRRMSGLEVDAACLTADLVGEYVPHRLNYALDPDTEVLEQYDAPYALIKIDGPRKQLGDETSYIQETIQLIETNTLKVIAEETTLTRSTKEYFAKYEICGPSSDQQPSHWRTRVFGRD